MHGLINKAFESFLTDTFGQPVWHQLLRQADLWDQIGPEGFETLHVYPDEVTCRMVAVATALLGRPSDSLLEDMGTYLVSHARTAPLRRLLRFGGGNYTDFLRSLDDLPGRARLAVPELVLPALTLNETGAGQFQITCRGCQSGFGHVLLGILRGMADDYGALVVLDHLGPAAPAPGEPAGPAGEALSIAVHDPAFHAGREFVLAAAGAGG